MENNKWVFKKPSDSLRDILLRCDFPGSVLAPEMENNPDALQLSRVVLGPKDPVKLTPEEFKAIPFGGNHSLDQQTGVAAWSSLGNVMAYSDMYIMEKSDTLADNTLPAPAMAVSVIGVRDRALAPKHLWLLAFEAALLHQVESIFYYYKQGVSVDFEGQDLWWFHFVNGQLILAPGAPSLQLGGPGMGFLKKQHFATAIASLKQAGASSSHPWVGEKPSLFQK